MALYRDVQPGDRLTIGDVVIEIVQKSGQRTRLAIDSPHAVAIDSVGMEPRPRMTRTAAAPAPQIPRPAETPAAEAERKPRLQLPQMSIPA